VSKPFRGVVNVDIRDSEPDWRPFDPPRAPDGAPSVLYIVLDDVGFLRILRDGRREPARCLHRHPAAAMIARE